MSGSLVPPKFSPGRRSAAFWAPPSAGPVRKNAVLGVLKRRFRSGHILRTPPTYAAGQGQIGSASVAKLHILVPLEEYSNFGGL